MDYLKLIKPKFHITFIMVILGALLFAPAISPSLFLTLLFLYLSFNVLLYGGIYTLNDIIDVESDKKHSLKKTRPLPSGKISRSSALIFAAILISFGLLSGLLFFSAPIVQIYSIFLVLNLFYTLVAKKIPYLELITNATTHPLRFFMGVVLVEGSTSHLLLFAIFLFAFGIACTKRKFEMEDGGWNARSILRFYSGNKLIFLQLSALAVILLLPIMDTQTSKILYLAVIVCYVMVVFGVYFIRPVKTFTKMFMFT